MSCSYMLSITTLVGSAQAASSSHMARYMWRESRRPHVPARSNSGRNSSGRSGTSPSKAASWAIAVAFETDKVTRALPASERMTCPSGEETAERVGLLTMRPALLMTSKLPRRGKWIQKSSRRRSGGSRTETAGP